MFARTRTDLSRRLAAIAVCGLIWLSGCATWKLRGIQSDFNQAVTADNAQTAEALGMLTRSQGLYDQVSAKLDDAFVDSLPGKLQGNAVTMRAIALWRTGQTEKAKHCAEVALQPKSALGARDKLTLGLLIPIAYDADRMRAYSAIPIGKDSRMPSLTWETYLNSYKGDFDTAARKARELFADPEQQIPPEVLAYAKFQRWRILTNQYIVCTHVDPADVAKQGRLEEFTSEKNELSRSVQEQKADIPRTSPLYRLAQSLEER